MVLFLPCDTDLLLVQPKPRDRMIEDLLKYAHTDVTCCRYEPGKVADRQAAVGSRASDRGDVLSLAIPSAWHVTSALLSFKLSPGHRDDYHKIHLFATGVESIEGMTELPRKCELRLWKMALLAVERCTVLALRVFM